MGRERRPYTFAGTEQEQPDARRYQEALRAWTGYLLRRQAQKESEKKHPARP